MPFAQNNSVTVVIPCYNEADRFQSKAFDDFLRQTKGVYLLFVNDGSSDDTLQILTEFMDNTVPDRVYLIDKKQNQGKAEAIRTGFLENKLTTQYMSYWDADLSTPLNEIHRMRDFLINNKEIQAVFGSRVLLLGHQIERRPLRFLFGRVFMTVMNWLLNFKVYDSQCGAKVFRTDFCEGLWDAPFITAWLFDVELLCRIKLKYGLGCVRNEIYELPLLRWYEVAGSKIKPTEFLKFPFELLKLVRHYEDKRGE